MHPDCSQNLGTRIKEGEKGFFYNFQREDKTIGTSQFFFPEQTENPQLIKEKVSEKVAKTGLKKMDKSLEITSSNPEEYLPIHALDALFSKYRYALHGEPCLS